MRRLLIVSLLLCGCLPQQKTQSDVIVEQAAKVEPIEYNGEFLDLAAKEFVVRAEHFMESRK